ncbi:MAG: glycine cleavage system protein GcvH [Leptospiraceae bacterium]|nr:glycine cleavage system protein GcvH [Leptospiraceae bacterium]MBK7054101.1 glycine cleavage system protein GcvH [Leptospiraceae bacterium]MBK9499775.1 glycine cleavage system protein GcvH [Leptospiraceae bacterium]MBL0262438.1 glycine cleavage system protein GcvH [Leptospiraceae bacterium]MBP9161680.1 glycine cleavage system protein GcvH [Leptospiraceae bacterium]
MTKILDGHKYTEKHEWVKIEGDTATFGISDFAQNALGDIVFVDLPKIGKLVKKGQSFGTIESVKAAEDLYAPLSGEVIEINPAISKDPSIVNKDAFGAWMIKVKNINLTEADSLMDSNKYKDFTATL